MKGWTEHLGVSLRLHFRNRMALIYGYLFPLIFLVAFWVLYRYEKVTLIRHLGELLTVSVLGGACFGLPTTLVSERERGVWRRYRLAPIPMWGLLLSTGVARYILILTAGLLQIAVGMAVGMPAPAHPLGLWVTFTAVSFAFIGLGLVIASLANNVPAVQALGQCIFLPMLIIGGVAVQLASLPAWAQHVSAFFPGRYAVEAMQACASGGGLLAAKFSLASLLLIGAAGCLAGGKLFRWDADQRVRGNPLWFVIALGAWLAVGLMAEYRGRIAVAADVPIQTEPKLVPQPTAIPTPVPTAMPVTMPSPSPTPTPTITPAPLPTPTQLPSVTPTPVATIAPTSTPTIATSAAPTATSAAPTSWEKVTPTDIAKLDYNLPPDEGVVSPIAPPDEQPEEEVVRQLNAVSRNLVDWPPDKEKDPVQRVRNVLYIAAVPDVVQLPVERFLPGLVLDHLEDNVPKSDLIKILAWIAMHPEQGTVLTDTTPLGVDAVVGDPEQVRERMYYYSLKFLARLTNRKY